ncbi:ScbR family autoregulator-binding transcription factor [Streptomyces sp. URMC 125]|uniref:ScbR family autoregulator-binding transcription factor n=1 Tax=Streptomyces sp. URMC 125 TaxID=3423419 RepID=UPI003F19D87F
MVKQERAVRTRANVLRAAAAEFDRSGYDGTSLSKVSKAAGLSVGALTFHFSTKAELADAVLEEGWSVTRAALERVTKESAPPLRTIIDLTLELARLMEEEVSVRSAVRLARELPAVPPWSDGWLPTVRELLDEAHRTGQLREDALPTDVTTLVDHLASGAEAYLRSRLASKSEYESAAARLERVWRLVLAGVSKEGVPEPPERSPARG